MNLKKIMSIVMLSLTLGGAVAPTVVNASEVIQTVATESQVEDNTINTNDEDVDTSGASTSSNEQENSNSEKESNAPNDDDEIIINEITMKVGDKVEYNNETYTVTSEEDINNEDLNEFFFVDNDGVKRYPLLDNHSRAELEEIALQNETRTYFTENGDSFYIFYTEEEAQEIVNNTPEDKILGPLTYKQHVENKNKVLQQNKNTRGSHVYKVFDNKTIAVSDLAGGTHFGTISMMTIDGHLAFCIQSLVPQRMSNGTATKLGAASTALSKSTGTAGRLYKDTQQDKYIWGAQYRVWELVGTSSMNSNPPTYIQNGYNDIRANEDNYSHSVAYVYAPDGGGQHISGIPPSKELTPYYGNVTINKTWDKQGSKVGAEGEQVTIEIYQGNTKVKSEKLGRDNTVTFSRLQVFNSLNDANSGKIKYTWKEVNKTDAYKTVRGSGTFTITQDKTITLTKANSPLNRVKTGGVKITKKWVDPNNSGTEQERTEVKIEISSPYTTTVVKSLGADNTVTFTNMPVYNDAGQKISYRWREINETESWTTTYGEGQFLIAVDVIADLYTNNSPENTVKKGGIQIHKIAHPDDVSAFHIENANLSGAEFAVYLDADKDGVLDEDEKTSVAKLTTDETGKASTEKTLYPGQYLLQETKAPIPYALSPTVYPVTVKADTINIDKVTNPIVNRMKTGGVKITKKWVDPNTSGTEQERTEVKIEISSPYTDTVVKTLGADNTVTFENMRVYDDSGAKISYHWREINETEYWETTYGEGDFLIGVDTIADLYTNNSPENTVKKGGIQIHKVADQADVEEFNLVNANLSGAEFAVYLDVDKDGVLDTNEKTAAATLKTDASGKASTGKTLYPGKYLLQETKAPASYILDTRVYPVTVKADTINIDKVTNPIVNSLQKGNIEVVKSIINDTRFANNASANKVTIKIESKEAGTLYYTESAKLDSNWKATFKDLAVGTYIVTETITSPTNMVIVNGTKEIEVLPSKTTLLNKGEIKNELAWFQIALDKTDSKNGDVLGLGYNFAVYEYVDGYKTSDYQTKATPVTTMKTNVFGKATSEKLLLHDNGTRKLFVVETEVKTNPDGSQDYFLNDGGIVVNASMANTEQTLSFNYYNLHKDYTGLEVEKGVTTDDGLVLSDFPLDGFEFTVYDWTPGSSIYGKVAMSVALQGTSSKPQVLITNTEGKASSGVLSANEQGQTSVNNKPQEVLKTYKIVETAVPKGYENLFIKPEPIIFTTGDLTKLNYFSIVNKLKTADLGVVKKDEHGRVVPGVKYALYRDLEKDKDGNFVIANNRKVGEAITNHLGKVEFKDLRMDYKYYIQEIDTPDNVILNDTIRPVSLNYNNQVVVNIQNEELDVDLELTKKAKDSDKVLVDAEYALSYVYNKVQKNQVKTTATNGKLTYSDLPIYDVDGKTLIVYTLTETKAPNGYNLNTEPVKFTLGIDKDGEVLINDVNANAANAVKIDTTNVDMKTKPYIGHIEQEDELLVSNLLIDKVNADRFAIPMESVVDAREEVQSNNAQNIKPVTTAIPLKENAITFAETDTENTDNTEETDSELTDTEFVEESRDEDYNNLKDAKFVVTTIADSLGVVAADNDSSVEVKENEETTTVNTTRANDFKNVMTEVSTAYSFSIANKTTLSDEMLNYVDSVLTGNEEAVAAIMQETNSDGYASFVLPVFDEYGRTIQYSLLETVAPDGYERDVRPHYFHFAYDSTSKSFKLVHDRDVISADDLPMFYNKGYELASENSESLSLSTVQDLFTVNKLGKATIIDITDGYNKLNLNSDNFDNNVYMPFNNKEGIFNITLDKDVLPSRNDYTTEDLDTLKIKYDIISQEDLDALGKIRDEDLVNTETGKIYMEDIEKHEYVYFDSLRTDSLVKGNNQNTGKYQLEAKKFTTFTLNSETITMEKGDKKVVEFKVDDTLYVQEGNLDVYKTFYTNQTVTETTDNKLPITLNPELEMTGGNVEYRLWNDEDGIYAYDKTFLTERDGRVTFPKLFYMNDKADVITYHLQEVGAPTDMSVDTTVYDMSFTVTNNIVEHITISNPLYNEAGDIEKVFVEEKGQELPEGMVEENKFVDFDDEMTLYDNRTINLDRLNTIYIPIIGEHDAYKKSTDANNDGKVSAGEEVTYEVGVSNTWSIPIDNVVIQDRVIEQLSEYFEIDLTQALVLTVNGEAIEHNFTLEDLNKGLITSVPADSTLAVQFKLTAKKDLGTFKGDACTEKFECPDITNKATIDIVEPDICEPIVDEETGEVTYPEDCIKEDVCEPVIDENTGELTYPEDCKPEDVCEPVIDPETGKPEVDKDGNIVYPEDCEPKEDVCKPTIDDKTGEITYPNGCKVEKIEVEDTIDVDCEVPVCITKNVLNTGSFVNIVQLVLIAFAISTGLYFVYRKINSNN